MRIQIAAPMPGCGAASSSVPATTSRRADAAGVVSNTTAAVKAVEDRMLVELDATSRQQARRILRSMVTSLGG